MISFEIGEFSIRKISKIIELTSERASFLTDLDQGSLEAMNRYAKISNIGASTRIENAILTDIEIDWIDTVLSQDHRPESFLQYKQTIENKLSKDKERSIEEVAGLRDVLNIVYTEAKNLFPLTEATLRGLHHELLKYYGQASHYLGKYKVASNSVIERKGNVVIREILKTADPGPMTEAAMTDLLQWYNQALPEYHWSLAVITEFVFQFLAIHPFQDGNGRMGRVLYILGILQSPDKKLAEVIPYLALDRHIEMSRTEYYLALRRCSEGRFRQDPREYRINYFFDFMLTKLTQSLEKDIDYYFNKHQKFLGLSPALKKVLVAFREHPEIRLKTGEIKKFTSLPRSTIIYALGELFREGFIQRMGRAAGTHYQLTF